MTRLQLEINAGPIGLPDRVKNGFTGQYEIWTAPSQDWGRDTLQKGPTGQDTWTGQQGTAADAAS